MKRAIIVVLAVLGAWACTSDDGGAGLTKVNTTPPPQGPEPVRTNLSRVDIDLAPHLIGVTPGARAFQIRTSFEQLDGPIAHGRPGDFVLQNDTVRYLIESDDRVMNPCPYGGTPLDASYRGGEDILGEVCLFVNAAQTLDPDKFEVLRVGGAAVLAVTGTLKVADYVNILGMAAEFLPNLQNLGFDPDASLPVTVTVYYILGGDSPAMKVVTAFRNESDVRQDLVVAHLVVSGGDGRYFNPISSLKGFGTQGSDFEEEKWPFLGFRGEEASYLFMPAEHGETPAGSNPIPHGGVYITISGVAAVATGITGILQALLAKPENRPNIEGILGIEPKGTSQVSHWFIAGDGSLSTILDVAYPLMDVATGVASGRVTDGTNAASGVRVTAVLDGRAISQSVTDAQGEFSMKVPPGEYQLLARRGGGIGTSQAVTVTAENETNSDIELTPPAVLTVKVLTPSGLPTPARVTVICVENPCPDRPSSQEADLEVSKLPENWQAITWLGMGGTGEISLPPGEYRVTVSRGFEWSLWPRDSGTNGGFPLVVSAGEEVQIDAEIAHVIDSSGALSSDFHVHALPSPDSNVPLGQRAANFLAEGVDVIVSTDHDIITNYAPTIKALGAQDELASMIGDEITTSDTGHFNAFPLKRNVHHRRGGALDWSPDYGLEPAQIFAWIRSHPGEQVIQMNHPQKLGMVNMTETDVLTGISYAPRLLHRLEPKDPDPLTQDTGLWSEDFTALELMTGTGNGRFNGVGRWWFTMLGRGFTPTATAVTDTHKLYGDLGGSPRSYIFVGEDSDKPATLDEAEFVTSVNTGKLVGSRGPFLEVSARNSAGDKATLGETIATGGAPVTFVVDVQTPDWFSVSRVKFYMNIDETAIIGPGVTSEEPIEPTMVVDTGVMTMVDVPGAPGFSRQEVHVEIPIESPVDAWVVVVVEGDDNMTPLTRSQTPFAFANPIYLDADGGGYNNPPLAAAAEAARAEAARVVPMRARSAAAVSLPLTNAKATHILHQMSCSADDFSTAEDAAR